MDSMIIISLALLYLRQYRFIDYCNILLLREKHEPNVIC